MKSENIGVPTKYANNLSESYDSDSIELFEDDSKEVDDMRLSNNNLFEKFSGSSNMNRIISKKLRDWLWERLLAFWIEKIVWDLWCFGSGKHLVDE
jgi:hypothetical protein